MLGDKRPIVRKQLGIQLVLDTCRIQPAVLCEGMKAVDESDGQGQQGQPEDSFAEGPRPWGGFRGAVSYRMEGQHTLPSLRETAARRTIQ